ncbi:MAG: 50S ribosomal protein L29 [Synechococcus sp.]|jgi:large subunit ribosomal protein L29|nr:50S ribosomal protein L29 [Synechococcus sp.]
MARPDIAEVRSLTEAEINEQIDQVRRELFDLRFEQATSRLQQPHRFRRARIKLAHLLSVQKERLRSAAS